MLTTLHFSVWHHLLSGAKRHKSFRFSKTQGAAGFSLRELTHTMKRSRVPLDHPNKKSPEGRNLQGFGDESKFKNSLP